MGLDSYQNQTVSALVVPDNFSASGTGTGIDISTYTGRAMAILENRGGGGTSPTLNVKIQHSTDDSTYTDHSTAATFTQATSGNGVQSIELDTPAFHKYIRAKYVLAGTNPTFDFGVVFVGQKQYN